MTLQDMALVEEISSAVLFYEGRYYMYSNFSAFAVEIDGNVCPTAEHAYQMRKFTDVKLKQQVLEARSAHDAKKIARRNDQFKRKDWHIIKLPTMEEVVHAKLLQHEFIQVKLLKTGERLIVEDSPTDSFWGRGPDWRGENNLGKIWVRQRTWLRAQQKTA